MAERPSHPTDAQQIYARISELEQQVEALTIALKQSTAALTKRDEALAGIENDLEQLVRDAYTARKNQRDEAEEITPQTPEQGQDWVRIRDAIEARLRDPNNAVRRIDAYALIEIVRELEDQRRRVSGDLDRLVAKTKDYEDDIRILRVVADAAREGVR